MLAPTRANQSVVYQFVSHPSENMARPSPQPPPRQPLRNRPGGWVLVVAAVTVLLGAQLLPRVFQMFWKTEFIGTMLHAWRFALDRVRSDPVRLISAALILLAVLGWMNLRLGRGTRRLRDTLLGLSLLVAFVFSLPGLAWLWRDVDRGEWRNTYRDCWNMLLDQTGGSLLPLVFYLLLVAILAAFGLLCQNLKGIGKQLLGRDALEVIESDSRPPVLYFRSFSDDPAGYDGMDPGLEASLQMVLRKVGPLVAIGRPGERLQTPGIPRMYVGNDWLEVAEKLMKEALLIVFRAGTSSGLWLEIERAVKLVEPRRVVFLLADDESPEGGWRVDERAFRERANGVFPAPLPESFRDSQLLAFGDAWEPRLTRAEIRGGLPVFLGRYLYRTRLLHGLLKPVLNGLKPLGPALPWFIRHVEKFLLAIAFLFGSLLLLLWGGAARDPKFVFFEILLILVFVGLVRRRGPSAELSTPGGRPASGPDRDAGPEAAPLPRQPKPMLDQKAGDVRVRRREQALSLLRNGSVGVDRWNRTRPQKVGRTGAGGPGCIAGCLLWALLFGWISQDYQTTVWVIAGVCLAIQGVILAKSAFFEWDLEGADLSNLNLNGVNLNGCQLSSAKFVSSDLRGATLGSAYLHSTNFSGADLRGAYLQGAMLCYVKFRDTDLRGADLSNSAMITDADFTGARYSKATLFPSDVLLDSLKGLGVIEQDSADMKNQ